MCGPRLCERYPDSELRIMTDLEEITNVVRRRRLRWYGKMMRSR